MPRRFSFSLGFVLAAVLVGCFKGGTPPAPAPGKSAMDASPLLDLLASLPKERWPKDKTDGPGMDQAKEWFDKNVVGRRARYTLGAGSKRFQPDGKGKYDVEISGDWRTEKLFGIHWSGGIWVNYLFAAVWLAEALWWRLDPASYARRPRALVLLVRGFLFIVIVNAALVFASATGRIAGAPLVAALAWTWRPARRTA